MRYQASWLRDTNPKVIDDWVELQEWLNDTGLDIRITGFSSVENEFNGRLQVTIEVDSNVGSPMWQPSGDVIVLWTVVDDSIWDEPHPHVQSKSWHDAEQSIEASLVITYEAGDLTDEEYDACCVFLMAAHEYFESPEVDLEPSAPISEWKRAPGQLYDSSGSRVASQAVVAASNLPERVRDRIILDSGPGSDPDEDDPNNG